MAITLNSSYDDIYNEIYNQRKASLDDAIKKSQERYGIQTSAVQDSFNSQIADAKESYEDQYRQNAIAKEISARQLAERMANLGLTDSGLNRTQQTAIETAYINNKGEINRARQKAVDALNLAMTQKLNEIKINQSNEESGLINNYNSAVSTEAQNIYKANQNEITAREKARLSAEAAAVKAASQTKSSSITNYNKVAEQAAKYKHNDSALYNYLSAMVAQGFINQDAMDYLYMEYSDMDEVFDNNTSWNGIGRASGASSDKKTKTINGKEYTLYGNK